MVSIITRAAGACECLYRGSSYTLYVLRRTLGHSAGTSSRERLTLSSENTQTRKCSPRAHCSVRCTRGSGCLAIYSNLCATTSFVILKVGLGAFTSGRTASAMPSRVSTGAAAHAMRATGHVLCLQTRLPVTAYHSEMPATRPAGRRNRLCSLL